MQKNIAQIRVHKDQLFWFLEHTQDFEVTVSGVTWVKGLKFHLQSHSENLIWNTSV